MGIGCGFVPYIAVEVIASIKENKLKSDSTLIPVLMNNTKLTSGDIFQAIKNNSQNKRTYKNLFRRV